MVRRSRFSMVLLVAALVALAVVIWAVWSVASEILGSLTEWVVAILSGVVMLSVGVSLTLGKGALAGAGQLEKVAVWAALLLSVASAVTTSTGLLDLLSANPQTTFALTVGLSLLIGIGVQLSMLIVALRVGENLQRFRLGSGRATQKEYGDDGETNQPGPYVWRLVFLLTATLLAIGLVLGFGIADIYQPVKPKA